MWYRCVKIFYFNFNFVLLLANGDGDANAADKPAKGYVKIQRSSFSFRTDEDGELNGGWRIQGPMPANGEPDPEGI